MEDLTATMTVSTLVRAATTAHGDRPVVRLDDRSMTYAELEERSVARARALLAAGVAKGTRVGILFGNGPEWVLWWAAVCRMGAVCVPLSTFSKPAEIARVARHADLHALVAMPEFLGRDLVSVLGEAFPTARGEGSDALADPAVPFLRWVAIEGAVDEPWCRAVADLVVAGSHAPWGDVLDAAEAEVRPSDEALVIYTSGQSAEPKGVVHTHGALTVKTHYLREAFGFVDGVQCEVTLPFFWVGGLMMGLLPTIAAGGTALCAEKSTWGTGQVVGSSEKQANPFAHLPMQASLGMTETLGIYAWSDVWRVPGYPLAAPLDVLQPGMELRLLDENDQPVADGERGGIALRGPTVAARIHKSPRADSYTVDGFYRTGDQAVREDGRLHFTGRIGDMIKTSGANVSPAEVERELTDLAEVATAHVVALDDPERDQVVGAAVVLADDATITVEEIQDRLRQRLSGYKVPQRILVVANANDLPMTPSLKIRRRDLATLIAEQT